MIRMRWRVPSSLICCAVRAQAVIAPTAREEREAAGRLAALKLREGNPVVVLLGVPMPTELVLAVKKAGALGIKGPLGLIIDTMKVTK